MDSTQPSKLPFSAPHPNRYALCSPVYTLVLPLRINPYTDGRAWARRHGYERHRGIRHGEELTDEEDEES